MNRFEDTLEPLGIGVGALLVVVGIATVLGTPWTHKDPMLPIAVLQLLGALAVVSIGVGLAWLAWTGHDE